MTKTLLILSFSTSLLILGCASELPFTNHHETTPPLTENLPKEATPSTEANPKSAEEKRHEDASETKKTYDIKLTTLELQKFAYELGLDPKKDLTEQEKQQVLDRKKLRQLERALDTQKERLQYSKVLTWLNNDQEKIDLLSIPSLEGRQVWINKNKIWSRAKDLKRYEDHVETQDISVGMPAEYVKRSWGEPSSVDVSGNPIYRNERWQYLKQISTPNGYKQERRMVYFEGGRVVGWETE